MRHLLHALKNAFFSRGTRLFGLPFILDYARFAMDVARHWGGTQSGARSFLGYSVAYANQSYFVFLVHEIFVGAAYDFQSERENPFVIDCGANIGIAVLFFKKRYPSARVLAFEPNAASYEVLERNVRENRLSAVDIKRAAVTDRNGDIELFAATADGGSLTASVESEWGGTESQRVAAVKLSDFIEDTVDFLKIDIEGGEYGVIADLCRSGKIRLVKEAMIEYHVVGNDSKRVTRLMEALSEQRMDVALRQLSPTSGMIHARRLV